MILCRNYIDFTHGVIFCMGKLELKHSTSMRINSHKMLIKDDFFFQNSKCYSTDVE